MAEISRRIFSGVSFILASTSDSMPKDTVNKYGGGGSNILRGGRRSYNCQTLVGNFVEASCQSATNNSLGGFQGGAIYRSTTKEQMQEGIQVESPLFGAALKPPRSLEHPQLLNNNSNVLVPYNNRGENTWESVTHSVHSGTDKVCAYSMYHVCADDANFVHVTVSFSASWIGHGVFCAQG